MNAGWWVLLGVVVVLVALDVRATIQAWRQRNIDNAPCWCGSGRSFKDCTGWEHD